MNTIIIQKLIQFIFKKIVEEHKSFRTHNLVNKIVQTTQTNFKLNFYKGK